MMIILFSGKPLYRSQGTLLGQFNSVYEAVRYMHIFCMHCHIMPYTCGRAINTCYSNQQAMLLLFKQLKIP